MLEGYNEEWQMLASGQNELFLNDIPPGKYVFKVRTEGNQKAIASVDIKINSFFSYKFWILFLLAALIIYLSANKLVKTFRLLKNRVSGITSTISKIDEITDEKYKYSKLTDAESKALCDRLFAYIEAEKPFSNSDLKIVDLAKALNCSSHTLSYIFNQYLTKNYYDFINEYRIKEFKRLVAGQESSKYTLSALAEQCGFSSRASFFRSFKKLTGITPSEYIRSIEKN